jgi:hypothetical protein
MRIRPWFIGLAFIVVGATSHAAFKVEPLPGRIEMGQFACFEALLYMIGLSLALVSLLSIPSSGKHWLIGCAVWLGAVLMAAVAVIDSLPP